MLLLTSLVSRPHFLARARNAVREGRIDGIVAASCANLYGAEVYHHLFRMESLVVKHAQDKKKNHFIMRVVRLLRENKIIRNSMTSVWKQDQSLEA